ncbi:S8 family serine peptidase [Xanthovirga aplysinae]|uniref:S8 family serine peptidase n=1 Tax=Xanthovirga aplysinae TaxID=2529853 RepID=UPI0012BCC818|nr:S8 family serine peptidase [Xanthovirga aplysinae]MTI33017.1 S8 family peptidase [Xanthovirga aplysinae]
MLTNFFKKTLTVFSVLAIVLMASCQSDFQNQLDQASVASQFNSTPGRYIITLKKNEFDQENPTFKRRRAFLERVAQMRSIVANMVGNQDNESAVGHVYTKTFYGFSARLSAKALERLKQNPQVAHIQEDKEISLVPVQAKIVSMLKNGSEKAIGNPVSDQEETDIDRFVSGEQLIPYGIERVGGPQDGTGKTVWIIDTGVDLENIELNIDQERSINLITQTDFLGRPINNPQPATAQDDNGHGTHVAGTIAAKNDNIGVSGVAAGATVVAVKVLDAQGNGYDSDVIAGIDYVAENAAPGDVVNMSLGGEVNPDFEGDTGDDLAVKAAADKGLIFAIAAGNDAVPAVNFSPARVSYENVYVVSAMDVHDEFAIGFSNYGDPISYSAPGVAVLSLWPDNRVAQLDGTSMASPHVAGVLLMTNNNPHTDGTVKNDPAPPADPIIHL